MALTAPSTVENYQLVDPAIIERSNGPVFRALDTSTKPARLPENTPASDTQAIFSSQSTMITDQTDTLLDRDWVKQAFLVSDITLDAVDAKNRYWSSADNKFVDTRLGGSIGVNARPQFTRYSDTRVKGRIHDRTDVSIQNLKGNHGLGRYYSEAIDDNAQTIYLRFGVPQFNSLMSFFGSAFDPDMTSLARTGRSASTWRKIGVVAGTIAVVSAFPVLSATLIIGRLVTTFFTRPTSKFYTLKPTMHTYWSAVNMIANTIAINKGIMPRILDGDKNQDQTIGNPYKLDQEYMANLQSLMPDMFTSADGIDVFSVANKAQRIANALNEDDYQRFNNGSASDFLGYVNKSYRDTVEVPRGEHSLVNWINSQLLAGDYYQASDSNARLEMNPKKALAIGTAETPLTPEQLADNDAILAENKGKSEQWSKFFDAEFRQGSQFAIFKVDHTGPVSEAFSSAVIESDLSLKFNGIGSSAREAKFSFADGNLTGSAVEGVIKGVLGAAADVVMGVAEGATLGVFNSLAGLAGSGYIDIPKHWQSSSAALPRTSYTMQLISPYGNPISQMQNIFIPLAMILAGTLPISTGKQSYTSPFICQLYDRGRGQVQLGMIESLSIVRGTCNLPFNNRGNAMAIDVTFSIVDMSSIMHMPLSTGSLFSADMSMDEDNILMDYLAVLAGQDLYSQLYMLPKAKLNLAKKLNNLGKMTSPAYWASLFHESSTTGMLSYIVPGNAFEGLVAGNSLIP